MIELSQRLQRSLYRLRLPKFQQLGKQRLHFVEFDQSQRTDGLRVFGGQVGIGCRIGGLL